MELVPQLKSNPSPAKKGSNKVKKDIPAALGLVRRDEEEESPPKPPSKSTKLTKTKVRTFYFEAPFTEPVMDPRKIRKPDLILESRIKK